MSGVVGLRHWHAPGGWTVQAWGLSWVRVGVERGWTGGSLLSLLGWDSCESGLSTDSCGMGLRLGVSSDLT